MPYMTIRVTKHELQAVAILARRHRQPSNSAYVRDLLRRVALEGRLPKALRQAMERETPIPVAPPKKERS